LREKKEKELEEQRDKIFNSYIHAHGNAREGVESQDDTSGRGGQIAEEAVKPPEAVKPADQEVRPGSPEMLPSFTSSVPMDCDDKLSSVPAPEGDEQLIDYSSSPERMDLEDN
jgi:hypothetical protein